MCLQKIVGSQVGWHKKDVACSRCTRAVSSKEIYEIECFNFLERYLKVVDIASVLGDLLAAKG